MSENQLEKSRLELHEILCDCLGSREAYFQPPTNVEMTYPAIVYSRDNIGNTFADNKVYLQLHAYKVIVMDKSPNSKIVARVSLLPHCRFVQHYKLDNLNHDVFIINH